MRALRIPGIPIRFNCITRCPCLAVEGATGTHGCASLTGARSLCAEDVGYLFKQFTKYCPIINTTLNTGNRGMIDDFYVSTWTFKFSYIAGPTKLLSNSWCVNSVAAFGPLNFYVALTSLSAPHIIMWCGAVAHALENMSWGKKWGGMIRNAIN